MKTLINTALAVALGAMAATPALANTAQQDIVVSPNRAMAEWRAEVSRDLSRNLDLAAEWNRYNPQTGIVQVRFSLDGNGKPVGLETYRSSGSVSTDRAAKWAVRRLHDLDRVPGGVRNGAMFQANIIFAQSRAQKDKLAGKLAWMEKKRLARNSGERNVIALGQ